MSGDLSERSFLARRKNQAALQRRSIDELPRVRSVETAYLDSLLKTRIEVVEVDTMTLRMPAIPVSRKTGASASWMA